MGADLGVIHAVGVVFEDRQGDAARLGPFEDGMVAT